MRCTLPGPESNVHPVARYSSVCSEMMKMEEDEAIECVIGILKLIASKSVGFSPPSDGRPSRGFADQSSEAEAQHNL